MRLDATASKLQLVNNHCFFIKTTSILSFHHRNKQFPTFRTLATPSPIVNSSGYFPMAFTDIPKPTLNPSSSSGLLRRRLTRFWKISFILPRNLLYSWPPAYLLPWDAFIPDVDYFSYLYPEASVDPTFAVVYMLVCLVCLLIIILYSRKSDAYVQINVGLGMFVVSLLIVPIIDAAYLKGRFGLYEGFYVTGGAVGLSAVADAWVDSGSVGAAKRGICGLLFAGTAASGSAFSFFAPI